MFYNKKIAIKSDAEAKTVRLRFCIAATFSYSETRDRSEYWFGTAKIHNFKLNIWRDGHDLGRRAVREIKTSFRTWIMHGKKYDRRNNTRWKAANFRSAEKVRPVHNLLSKDASHRDVYNSVREKVRY